MRFCASSADMISIWPAITRKPPTLAKVRSCTLQDVWIITSSIGNQGPCKDLAHLLYADANNLHCGVPEASLKAGWCCIGHSVREWLL